MKVWHTNWCPIHIFFIGSIHDLLLKIKQTWEAFTKHFNGSRSLGVSYFLIALFQCVSLENRKEKMKRETAILLHLEPWLPPSVSNTGVLRCKWNWKKINRLQNDKTTLHFHEQSVWLRGCFKTSHPNICLFAKKVFKK